MKKPWLVPSVLGLMVLLIIFILVFYFETSLAISAQILFSGSLVVTSVLLFRTQKAFNKYVREKDNLDLISGEHPSRRFPTPEPETFVSFRFLVTNPAPMVAILYKVHIENSELSNKSWETVNWSVMRMDIGRMVSALPQTTSPALVQPHGSISVLFRTRLDKDKSKEVLNITELKWRFDYQIGNYKMKSTSYKGDVA